MPSTIGPIFAFQAEAPLDWNQPLLVEAPTLILKTEQGVAYEVEVPSASLREKLFQGPMWVFVAQVIREDAENFFIFESPLDRALFIELKELKDVGPKLAATLVSELGVAGLSQILRDGTWAGPKIPGLGPKTLESLIFGLGKRKKQFQALFHGVGESRSSVAKAGSTQALVMGLSQDLVKAFENLGLPVQATQKLFEECVQAEPSFLDWKDQEKLKKMLQQWGLSRVKKSSELSS